MATSVDDLKRRLREFLADPHAGDGFRLWFASLLADVRQENSEDVEGLVHTIHLAFSDAAEGLCTSEELRKYLADLTELEPSEPGAASEPQGFQVEAPGVSVLHYQIDNLPFDPCLGIGPVYFGYFQGIFQTSFGVPSASGAFYSPVSSSPELRAADGAQPTAWRTAVVDEPAPASLAA